MRKLTKEEARLILRMINKGDFRSTCAYRTACRLARYAWDVLDAPTTKGRKPRQQTGVAPSGAEEK